MNESKKLEIIELLKTISLTAQRLSKELSIKTSLLKNNNMQDDIKSLMAAIEELEEMEDSTDGTQR